MLNSELIQLLANSVRDPGKDNYSPATLASALQIAKYKLIGLVGKNNIPPIVSFDSATINPTGGGVYGYIVVPSNFDEMLSMQYTSSGSTRPVPIEIVDLDELSSYQYKYSGADEYEPKAARESQGNVFLILGVKSGTALIHYRRKSAIITDNNETVDIPDHYLPNLIEIAQSILLSWEEKYEASELKMKRQIEELKMSKQEKDGEVD